VTLQSRRSVKEHQLAVRMPTDLLAMIDREVDRRREASPGTDVSRSDVIRDVLYRDLMKTDQR
jgi:Arc/MetJ-type ribon-helix-helix transcriptional regulator